LIRLPRRGSDHEEGPMKLWPSLRFCAVSSKVAVLLNDEVHMKLWQSLHFWVVSSETPSVWNFTVSEITLQYLVLKNVQTNSPANKQTNGKRTNKLTNSRTPHCKMIIG